MNEIRILDFLPEHQPDFEKLNRAWIEKYFEMEQRDVDALTRPKETILNKGGAIFMAECNGQIAGTVALRKVNDWSYELSKMAVDENFRRRGIAEALVLASFKKAKSLGATTVFLYSQTILVPALRLYEKMGFRHVPLGNCEYARSDVKMEISIEEAMRSLSRHHLQT